MFTTIYDQIEVFGREPIRITLLLSLFSALSGFGLENSLERSPMDSPVAALFPSKFNGPFASALALWLALITEFTAVSTTRLVPQEQDVSFLKQGLWNTASQDLHLSTSPSC